MRDINSRKRASRLRAEDVDHIASVLENQGKFGLGERLLHALKGVRMLELQTKLQVRPGGLDIAQQPYENGI